MLVQTVYEMRNAISNAFAMPNDHPNFDSSWDDCDAILGLSNADRRDIDRVLYEARVLPSDEMDYESIRKVQDALRHM